MKPDERQVAGVSDTLYAAWAILTPLSAKSPRWQEKGIALIDEATRAVKKALDFFDGVADDMTEWEKPKGGQP